MPSETPTEMTKFSEAKQKCSYLRRIAPRFPNQTSIISGGILIIVLALIAVEPASAQTGVGSVYCGTAVENGIDMIFGAIAGLGLPLTMFYMVRGGYNYMRAGGRPQRKDNAREQIVMAGMGFGIVVLALAAPEMVDKFGSQLGFNFSECVQPL